MNFYRFLSLVLLVLNSQETFSATKNQNKKNLDQEACVRIAALANHNQLSKYVSDEIKGIKYNNRLIDLHFSTQGTAHVPYVEGFDSKTHKELSADEMPTMPVNMEELWGGDELGVFKYKNFIHILYFKDYQHPLATTSVTNGNNCGFSTDFKEKIGEKAIEPALCKRIMNYDNLTPLTFTQQPHMSRDEVSETYGESELTGARTLDFKNDGKPENVAKVELSSGAGAGCDETFFDAVDKNVTKFVSGKNHDLLMKLQGADPSNRYPILPCDNNSSFFKYNGRVYFHIKPNKWPPIDNWNQYHRVTTIKNEKVIDVCDFKLETKIR